MTEVSFEQELQCHPNYYVVSFLRSTATSNYTLRCAAAVNLCNLYHELASAIAQAYSKFYLKDIPVRKRVAEISYELAHTFNALYDKGTDPFAFATRLRTSVGSLTTKVNDPKKSFKVPLIADRAQTVVIGEDADAIAFFESIKHTLTEIATWFELFSQTGIAGAGTASMATNAITVKATEGEQVALDIAALLLRDNNEFKRPPFGYDKLPEKVEQLYQRLYALPSVAHAAALENVDLPLPRQQVVSLLDQTTAEFVVLDETTGRVVLQSADRAVCLPRNMFFNVFAWEGSVEPSFYEESKSNLALKENPIEVVIQRLDASTVASTNPFGNA